MTRTALIAVAALTITGLTACVQPPVKPQVLSQLRYTCDPIHMPGNELGWCVTWTRKDGTPVTGPQLRYNHEVSIGIVRLP